MLNDQSRQFFQNWYKSNLGHNLLQLELDEVASELDSSVGYYLVTQSPLKDFSLKNHRLRESILIAPVLEFGAPDNTIVARACELPFEADGVDVHVFHHALDTSATPHDDLREAARTLLPSGKLIIIGFNPWGLWGFIAHQRLEDWLKVAGLTLETKRFIHYEPPLQSGKWRSRFSWIDKILSPLKLPFSGVYVMTATKQEKRYIPLKPRWSGARVRVPPLTKPTAKEMKE